MQYKIKSINIKKEAKKKLTKLYMLKKINFFPKNFKEILIFVILLMFKY